MILALEDEGYGSEEEVEDAVIYGDVDGHEEDDRGEEEKFYGPHNAAREEFFGGNVGCEFGAEIGVSGFFSEARSFAFEEDGSVGFAIEEEKED